MENFKYLPVLTIAGSDSGGGAGIQADLKTFSALGCFGTSAITVITAQNTLGIFAIHPIPTKIVQNQIISVMEDIKPLTIKIGMVYSAEIVIAIAETLKNYPNIPIIFDPVMSASSGNTLVQKDTVDAFKKYLFPLVTLLTPNLFEAALLIKQNVTNLEEVKNAAAHLLNCGLKNVLIKGGHLQGGALINFYQNQEGEKREFHSIKIKSQNLHGTGCTLSSAIAAYLAKGDNLTLSIEKATIFVHEAIKAAINMKIGKGTGPLNHFFNLI